MSEKKSFIQIKSFEEIVSDPKLFDLAIEYKISSSMCDGIYRVFSVGEILLEFEFFDLDNRYIHKNLCEIVENEIPEKGTLVYVWNDTTKPKFPNIAYSLGTFNKGFLKICWGDEDPLKEDDEFKRWEIIKVNNIERNVE